MEFIIGIRKVKIVPAVDAISEFEEQRIVSRVSDKHKLVKKKGKVHYHDCTLCHDKVKCTNGEDCKDTKATVCPKCWKTL